mmetsp:Transcript_10016/g.19033  ORF Transcript_10016/g.19033 Transcript_10016/m.19033 type:complete len:298 (-) Transcript_10016:2049-2942(-)
MLQTTNGYQHKQRFPYIPGFEVSGVVVKTGRRVANRFALGDRVMGVTESGGMQTVTVLDARECRKVPDGFTFAQGSAFWVAYSTGFHCLVERGRVKASDVVLVNSATGGMGFAAAQLAKRVFGCTVIATGGSDEKLAAVKANIGVDHVINYTTNPQFSERVKSLTGGKGVDLVFDPVGGDVFLQGLKSTAFGARVLVVGFTSGDWSKISANYVLIKCLSIIGCRAGEAVQRHPTGFESILKPRIDALLRWAEQGKLRPLVSHTFPLTQQGVQGAFRCVLNRKVIGRVCVVNNCVSSL